jgi:hypothetical protein
MALDDSHDPHSPLTGIGRFIGRHGFATFVAVLLLWFVLFRRGDTVSAKDVSQLQSTVQLHATEMTSRITESRQWNSQMLRFAYLNCLHDAKTQHDRDVCEAVLR